MKQQQFTDHPKLPGVCYGFHERFKNGQRVLAHSSIFLGYTGLMALIPEQNLGLFITYNKFQPKFHEELINRFLDQSLLVVFSQTALLYLHPSCPDVYSIFKLLEFTRVSFLV